MTLDTGATFGELRVGARSDIKPSLPPHPLRPCCAPRLLGAYAATLAARAVSGGRKGPFNSSSPPGSHPNACVGF